MTQVNQDNIASVSVEEAEQYALSALETGKTQGYQGAYRFWVSTEEAETLVIFLNSERELQNVQVLLLVSLGVAGGGNDLLSDSAVTLECRLTADWQGAAFLCASRKI